MEEEPSIRSYGGGGVLSVAPDLLDFVSFSGDFQVFFILISPAEIFFDRLHLGDRLHLNPDSMSIDIVGWLVDWFFWGFCAFLLSCLVQVLDSRLRRGKSKVR